MADRPLWTADELIVASGGVLHGRVTKPVNGVSIDSRTIATGDLFVAIKGDKMDGHDYAAKALAAGAGVALVQRLDDAMLVAGCVLQVTDDPLEALIRLGKAARARSHAKIIAVTGSVGKTSVKEMLRTALGASGATHASAASFNNHWGVPLTLARMHPQTAYGVFEIGMSHAGEITPLVGFVRPHIAIVTTIAPSHLGNFASLDRIAAAKAEIFSSVEAGGAAIINRDTPFFDFLSEEAKRHGVSNIVSFGEHRDSSVRLMQVALHPGCCCVTAEIMGELVSYKLGLAGKHMAINSLAVLAAVKLAGADVARAALALAVAENAKGRGQQVKLQLPRGQFTLVDESYNANPESMRAALALFDGLRPSNSGRRIAILGDMLELGAFSQDLHAAVAEAVQAHDVDLVYASGPEMKHLWNAVEPERRGAYAEASSGLIESVLSSVIDGDVVMIKGSNGSKMGLIADALRAKFPQVGKEN
jgi:UDP-N-acetylmuramoyl-tripeptide--D-alanyl-D-alanine ligase